MNDNTVNEIIASLDISVEEFNKPMNHSSDDPKLGLSNPYSIATMLILYMYSIEIGTPQLYAEANRVSRTLDYNLIKELGPFLKALSVITLRSEKFKNEGEFIKTGKMIDPFLRCNMLGSFLLF